MIRKLLLILCATALVGVPAFGQTADELIEKNMRASGGAAWRNKLKAIKAVRMTGKIKIGAVEAPITISRARPNLLRLDFTVREMAGTQAFDGKTGWSFLPFMGQKAPERMSDDKTRDIEEDADFDGPMLNYKAKGSEVELLGKESVQGVQAYKLRVTTKNGTETTIYIDADTYLQVREERKRTIDGHEIETDTNVGNYKEVDGILFPTRIQTKTQTISLDRIELNPTLGRVAFLMPGDQEEEASNDAPSGAEADGQEKVPADGDESEKTLSVDTIAKVTSGSSEDQSGDSSHKKRPQKALTNEDIVKLVKAELGDKVIIDKINASPGDKLDTSTDALIKLKKAGVSKAVIDAMVKRADE